jgi:hypothetical protein
MIRVFPWVAFLCLCICASVFALAQEPAAPPSTVPSLDTASTQAPAPSSPAADSGEPAGPSSEERDPLLDVPPMPTGPVTLVGGTVKSVDRIRNRVIVRPFGGGGITVNFDERTHIYRDGIETTELGIHKGDRIYVDTMLDSARVFARNIRIETAAHPADTDGQILSFNPATGMLSLRDQLLGQRVTFRVGQNTVITRDRRPAHMADLKPGSLISVRFAPFRANSGSAQSISILAEPGSVVMFLGKVTDIDLRSRLLSVENQTDKKIYDVQFSPARVDKWDQLSIGSQVLVQAVFDGNGYLAQSVEVEAAAR